MSAITDSPEISRHRGIPPHPFPSYYRERPVLNFRVDSLYMEPPTLAQFLGGCFIFHFGCFQ